VRSPCRSARSLDNLIFVINCNLQRLDGPVRGATAKNHPGTGGGIPRRPAGICDQGAVGSRLGSYLLERIRKGLLKRLMENASTASMSGTSSPRAAHITREHFLSASTPELKEIGREHVGRGDLALEPRGHDPQKVYAAYASAVANKGSPTVILAKTVKGFGMGKAGEGLNSTHQQKKLSDDALKKCAIASTSRLPTEGNRRAVLIQKASLPTARK